MDNDNTTVFRVQDKHGRGPWRPGFSHRWVEPRPDHEHLPPYFAEFGTSFLVGVSSGYLGCGCRTEDQLRRWFTESEYQTLKKHGYKAVRMAVDRVLVESDRQCVFVRSIPLADGAEPILLY